MWGQCFNILFSFQKVSLKPVFKNDNQTLFFFPSCLFLKYSDLVIMLITVLGILFPNYPNYPNSCYNLGLSFSE